MAVQADSLGSWPEFHPFELNDLRMFLKFVASPPSSGSALYQQAIASVMLSHSKKYLLVFILGSWPEHLQSL